MDSKHQTVEERQLVVERKLNEYEGRCGLPATMAPGSDLELNEYLIMSKDTLQALDMQECSSIAYRLAQFSLYITRLLNLEKSTLLWAEALMKERVAIAKDSFGQYTKHEMKFDLLAQEDSFAQKLNEIIRQSTQRIQRLDGIAIAINFLAKILLDIRRSKYTREPYNG